MDFAHLDQQLRDSLLDLKLSNEERDELRPVSYTHLTLPTILLV